MQNSYRTRSPWLALPALVPAAGTRPCPLALFPPRHYRRHRVLPLLPPPRPRPSPTTPRARLPRPVLPSALTAVAVSPRPNPALLLPPSCQRYCRHSVSSSVVDCCAHIEDEKQG